MIALLADTTTIDRTIILGADGVTVALVAYVLAAMIWPASLKSRVHYYICFFSVLGLLLIHGLAQMIGSAAFQVFGGVVQIVLQVIALISALLATGGMSMVELKGEMKGAFEVIRRGETKKEIIIPLTGAVPKAKEPSASPSISIDPVEIPRTPPAPPPDRGSVPLE